VSVLYGAILLIAAGAGALGLAAYSIVFGIPLTAFALRLRGHRHGYL